MALSASLRKALMRALQRSLQNSRMANMSRVSRVPFWDEGHPVMLAHAPYRVTSDIDPRAVMGGAALASMPIGALTAKGLEALRPYEGGGPFMNDWLADIEPAHDDLMGRYRKFTRGGSE